ncbi:unnamed protein product [Effrenium voratum]|nr:unnamed protein product [Effrenium voratum]|mmetsp:Transcript_13350/g.31732  ORF Transcript_13350/g.31732 Transcript_13350/m.31732 type:complete len:191 (+) Transcript_13350:50-622(+)
MVEFEYDMTKWKEAKIWSGGPVEDWEAQDSKKDASTVAVHPRDMMDYHGLRNTWPRELYSRALCVGEDQYLEVIKLQEELKFHFYYTGLDPMDGTDDPKDYMCLVVYSKPNWKGIARGLTELGIQVSDSEEEAVDKDTEDLGIQMMLRASDAWVTYCDPWMKREFVDNGVLQQGKVYRFKEDNLKEKLGL